MTLASLERRDEPFVAGKTALLLIDMQRIWLEPGANPSHADWAPDHYFYRETSQRAIPNQVKLLAAARAAGVEVLHTIIQSLTVDGRDRSLDHKLSPIHVSPRDPLRLPPTELLPGEDEILLPKTSSGVFNSTAINYVLRNLNVHYLVIAGIMTDQCVDMAVRDGADLGYRVTCVADACAATTQDRHDNALKAFGGYCWVSNTAPIVERFNGMARTKA